MSILDSPPTLIPIQTHSLALYTHGPPPPDQNTPVLVFLPGIASSRLSWSAVVRLLLQGEDGDTPLRSYTYDRSGYTNSEPSPPTQPPSAENIALELFRLIQNSPAPLSTNPLILVGHSWAGVMINEFILLCRRHRRSESSSSSPPPPKIAGLVLVDANHETALQVLDPNDPSLAALSAGVEPYEGKGLNREHKLAPEEWKALRGEEMTAGFGSQADKEDAEYEGSFVTLRGKKKEEEEEGALLESDTPIFVIGGMRSRDWGRMYERGVERGNGTEEERRRVRELIGVADGKSEGLMRRHLELNNGEEGGKGKGKLVFARNSGHFVHLTEPEVVVDGVRWVLGELGEKRIKS